MRNCFGMLLIVMGGLFFVGCETVREKNPPEVELSSPRQTIETYYDAVKNREYAAILECVDPALQPEHDRILYWIKKYDDELKELQLVMNQKFGKGHFERYKNRECLDLFERPLYGAGESGKVDWTRIRVIQKADWVELEVDGESVVLAVRKVNGKWYITWEGGTKSYAEARRNICRELKKYYGREKSLVAAIKNGHLTKDNFYPVLSGEEACPGIQNSGKCEVRMEKMEVK